MHYDRTTPMGPCVKKLFVHFMSASIMDAGRVKTVRDAINAISALKSPETRYTHAYIALDRLNNSLAYVHYARSIDNKPTLSDEDAASLILLELSKKKPRPLPSTPTPKTPTSS